MYCIVVIKKGVNAISLKHNGDGSHDDSYEFIVKMFFCDNDIVSQSSGENVSAYVT